ncbi:conserved hypothetical protein [Ricinus communis]|uniref:Uncharacterized protein n=1 Tax=Ricinus communis TaxID=3988 RepID=B9RHJ7_RICCO|nr:conserved hypothetical protein [Ricinus communis]
MALVMQLAALQIPTWAAQRSSKLSVEMVGEDGATVACKSGCEAFELQHYCCSGEFAQSYHLPPFYSFIFKQA